MKQATPPAARPLVIRQAWMMTLEDGSRHDHGYSFHLKESDLVDFTTAELESHDPAFQAEPIGEPEWVHITEEQYALIRTTPHGLRVTSSSASA